MIVQPRSLALYLNCCGSVPKPASLMARDRHRFFTIPFTFKSSITILSKRRTRCVIGERDRLIMSLPVAVGGTNALAIRRPCFCERTARACSTMHDIFERLGVDGLEHAVDRELGDRDIPARLRVTPCTHVLELGLGEGAGKLRGRDTAFHVGQFGEDLHREDTRDRVLASLRAANVGTVRELRGERAQCRQILRGTTGVRWRPHIQRKITGPGEQPLQILTQRRDGEVIENAMRVGLGPVRTGKPLRLAKMGPVRRLITSCRERGSDHRTSWPRVPGNQSAHTSPSTGVGSYEDEGGDVRQHTRLGENQEARGVRDQIQPVDLIWRPSDPPIP